jgi:hypothetical protein
LNKQEIEQETLTKEQKKLKDKQELEELDKMLADLKRTFG